MILGGRVRVKILPVLPLVSLPVLLSQVIGHGHWIGVTDYKRALVNGSAPQRTPCTPIQKLKYRIMHSSIMCPFSDNLVVSGNLSP